MFEVEEHLQRFARSNEQLEGLKEYKPLVKAKKPKKPILSQPAQPIEIEEPLETPEQIYFKTDFNPVI